MRFLPVLVLLFFLFSVAGAQPPAVSPTPPENEDCALTDPEFVTLNVSVWSKNNGFLKDLTDKDFEVLVGKNKLPIEFFGQTDEPASIGILFDLSESMQNLRNSKLNEIQFAIDGLISFINGSNSKNEYFIIAFAKDTTVLLEPTQDKKQIESVLKTLVSMKPAGGTSFYDAVNKGFEKISGSCRFNKKILLAISDGMDTNSKNNYSVVKKQNRENPHVAVYQMNILTNDTEARSQQDLQSEAFFQTLTDNSGGRIFYPRNHAEVIEAFGMLAEELKSQYKISFKQPFSGGTKKYWRALKVNLNLPKERREESGKLFVRAQKGFYF